MKFSALIPIGFTVSATAHPNIYLIRHAEKNSDGTISDVGMQRAQCIANIFGSNSTYNISKIIVQTPHPGNSRHDHLTQRPYNTTLPLATALNLTMDTSCEYDDMQCAADRASSYNGNGNVLIGWEHTRIGAIVEDLGGTSYHWPDDVYDWILNQPYPYTDVTKSYQNCTNIDN